MRRVQDEAQANSLGLWGPDELLKVDYSMPESMSFLDEWRGKPVESVVEQVRDGSLLRVRLLLSSRRHQIINLHLAGVKAPRLSSSLGAPSAVKNGGVKEPAEPFGEEAKFFVESRLLQRNVKVTLLSQPTAAPTPFAATASGAPAPPPVAAVLIGTVLHPVGDIAQFLLSAGLARCVDWHAGMLARQGGMEPYRLAEKAAKDKHLNIWKDFSVGAAATGSAGALQAAVNGGPRTFEATVCRIVSGDTLHVARSPGAAEERIQLSSVRQPSTKDPKQAGYANEAREFVRRRLIGRKVIIQLDYVKNEGEERRYATVRLQGKPESNVGELVLERGLCTVQRHRRDDEARSPEFDRLVAAEAKAVAEKKGLHSGIESALPRLNDASENLARATSFLPGFKRAGRVPAVVDFVTAAGRMRILVPRENARLTLVLGGIRAPKTARNPGEKDEPFGREALEWVTQQALQRDVELEVTGTDKSGGFVGTIYIGMDKERSQRENITVSLVQQGLARVHAYSAESLPYASQLFAAEEEAKSARKNLWADYDAEAEEAANKSASNGYARPGAKAEPAPSRQEYVDCVISDVRGDGTPEVPFGFAVQILGEGTTALETVMEELGAHHRNAGPAGPGFTPRGGDYVSARFSADGAWYRAQVKRSQVQAKRADVRYIDYGNSESLPWTELRPLDPTKFGIKRLSAQASEARLSFVKLYDGKQIEYVQDGLDRFRDLAEGRKMIANIDMREPIQGSTTNSILHLTLYDPSNPDALSSPQGCINVDLIAEGHALKDTKCLYWNSYASMKKAIEEAELEARRGHRGMYEFGDPTEAD